MAVFKILEDNTACLVKSIPPEKEEEFLKLNPKGFVRVENYPPCKFETWRYNTETGEVEIDRERFIQQAIKTFSEELKRKEFERIAEVLDSYGYFGLDDVRFWKDQDPDDPEPKGLLEWYKTYDNTIWEEIDNLQNKTFEELKNYDPVEVERRIFEQTKDKLPPLED